MIYLVLLLSLITILVVGRLSYVRGMNKGSAIVEARWEKLKKIPIAGQKIQVPGFGDVMVLGLGWDEDVELIDYIPLTVLQGKLPSDIDPEDLDANTISCPLERFVAQCELSIKYL